MSENVEITQPADTVVSPPVVPAEPLPEPPNPLENEHLRVVYDGLQNLIHGRAITPTLIMRLVANGMMLAAATPVNNWEKKQLVSAAIEQLIRKSNLSQEEIDTLMCIVDGVVGEAIDVIADVRKGKILPANGKCCWR